MSERIVRSFLTSRHVKYRQTFITIILYMLLAVDNPNESLHLASVVVEKPKYLTSPCFKVYFRKLVFIASLKLSATVPLSRLKIHCSSIRYSAKERHIRKFDCVRR